MPERFEDGMSPDQYREYQEFLGETPEPPKEVLKKPRKRSVAATETDRLPPHSEEAERGVLGCILTDPTECMEKCAEELKSGENVFYDLRHQVIYSTLLKMHDARLPIDIITLQQKLKDSGRLEEVGGIPYLSQLQDSIPSKHNLPSYIEIVLKKSVLRRVISSCTEVVGRAYEGNADVDSMMSTLESSVLSIQKSKTILALNGKDSGLRMIDDLERRMNLNGALSGLDTGYYDLNKMTEGLQYGEQAIIGARPSQGKTALGLCVFAHCVFELKIPALFISLEMSVEAVMRRLLSSTMKIPLKDVRRGSYDQSDYGKIATFNALCAKSPMEIIDGVDGVGIREICSKVRRSAIANGTKLVVIDYLQKIRPAERHEKRTYEVGAISERLKALAVEAKVAMLTLAQLNRENVQQKGRPPRISDLADSGQIERDADTIALIHRKEEETMLIIGKQRDGETGVVPMYFNGKYCRFENKSYNEEQ